MRRVLYLLLLLTFLTGCSSEASTVGETVHEDPVLSEPEVVVPEPEIVEPEKTPEPEVVVPEPEVVVPSTKETIALCDSLCGSDRDAYCAEERTIIIDGKEVVGTCRAHSQSDHENDFNRCEGFCKPYPKTTTYCTTDGKTDVDCDGKV